MSEKRAIYKVPNGKLLKIFLHENQGAIESVTITGDFFMYPEESLVELEKKLAGVKLDLEILRTAISDFMQDTKSVFYGLDAYSLAQTIINASLTP